MAPSTAPCETYRPTGFVREDPSNAVWGMQFIWPIKADYRVMYLSDDYTQTVIGRNKRDYVWIMARTPTIPESEYTEIVQLVEAQGYDIQDMRRVPQDGTDQQESGSHEDRRDRDRNSR